MLHVSKRSMAKPKQAGARRSSASQGNAGVPRFMHCASSANSSPHSSPQSSPIQTKMQVNAPGDHHERQADSVARDVISQPDNPGSAEKSMPQGGVRSGSSDIGSAIGSYGRPLDAAMRGYMEPRIGADLGHVRIHTGAQSESLNRDLGSNAFTRGNEIFFGAGKRPGRDELTAHELTHVVQQTGGRSGPEGPEISARTGGNAIQRDINGSFPVTNGGFEVDLQTREGGLATPPTLSGLDGYIRFIPNPDAPDSNDINMIQMARIIDTGGADVAVATMPAAQSPRGSLGDPGLRTKEDADAGVEGGYFIDVHHQNGSGGAPVAAGSPLSPHYAFRPTAPGETKMAGTVQQPPQYGSGIGGVAAVTRGFKRSDDPADIRSVALYDTPGVPSAGVNWDFSFESVARGEDIMMTYAAATWGFSVRAGHVINEYFHPHDMHSATMHEAMERFRDFYVHEPVTFYFDFDRATLSAAEAAKISTFLPYLTRNPSVQLSLEGFADIVGGPGSYNADLSIRRVEAVERALLASGIARSSLSSISTGHGASTASSTDAGTGDQGGNPAVGADQSREANRWTNRRVVLTFSRPTPAPSAPSATPVPSASP